MKKSDMVIGKEYKVLAGGAMSDYCEVGDIVVYIEDDGSDIPKFRNTVNGRTFYQYVKFFEEVDPFTNLKPGDIISSDSYEDKYLVLGIYSNGEKVALVDLYDDTLSRRVKTIEQLRDGHWVKGHKPEEKVTEMTLQEVADKVGVDVSKLRIKE